MAAQQPQSKKKKVIKLVLSVVVTATGTIRLLVKFPSIFTYPQKAILNKQTNNYLNPK